MQWERRASPAKQANLAFQEKAAPRDPKEKGERRASRALRVLLDPLDPKALPETMVLKAALAQWVFLEIPVPLESLAPRVKMVPLVTKEMMVNPGRRDPPALLANQVHLDLQEKGVPRAPQALKADRERKGPREKLAWKALLGRLAPSVPRGPLGSPDPMAFEGSLALWVNKVSQDPQARMVPPALWVPQDFPASKEILVPKVKRVIQA